MAQQNNQQQTNRKSQNSTIGTQSANKKTTPMIVQRVNRIPVVSMAVSIGFSQYGKLKSSSVTVGDVMNRAESWAFFLWEKVQPIVEKLQEPINKADQIACHTLDFVENKLNTLAIKSNYFNKTQASA